MDAGDTIAILIKPRWRWLGVAALLPLLSGCYSLQWAADRDQPTNPLVVNAKSPPRNDQIVQASLNGSVNQTPANTVRFALGGPTDTGDTAESNRPRMTFDQAVQTTLMADPRIRAGLENITQARADLLTSGLLPNPTVLVDGLMLPTRPVNPANTSGPVQTDVFTSFPIDWFVFGKRAAAMASAREGVRQSEADYADLIRQRVATTASAFYDVVEAKALLELAREDVVNLRKVETITAKARDAGNRTKVDLDRVRLDMLKSEQAVRDAESTLATAKAKLRAMFGRTDGDPDFDVASDIDAPLTAESMPIETAYGLATENRPDIQSLRVQVAKADADIVVENRKKYPDVSPAFGYTRQFQGQALGQPDAETWNASLTTTVPIFNRNQGNRWKARSIAAQNRFNLDAALVDLRAEITQAVHELDTAQKNANAIAQDQKKSAKDVLDAITKAYEAPAGGMKLIDVLDAERTYRDMNRAYISSRANYWRAVYRFSSAVGKQIGQP